MLARTNTFWVGLAGLLVGTLMLALTPLATEADANRNSSRCAPASANGGGSNAHIANRRAQSSTAGGFSAADLNPAIRKQRQQRQQSRTTPTVDCGPTGKARLTRSGKAVAPSNAPLAVKRAIRWANHITDKPYVWGGGHGRFFDRGYDCSGAISFALRGARQLSSPLNSTGFMNWGRQGKGRWITVYTKSSHAYIVIAGLRFDTSGTGGNGPRWHSDSRSPASFVARHPAGL